MVEEKEERSENTEREDRLISLFEREHDTILRLLSMFERLRWRGTVVGLMIVLSCTIMVLGLFMLRRSEERTQTMEFFRRMDQSDTRRIEESRILRDLIMATRTSTKP